MSSFSNKDWASFYHKSILQLPNAFGLKKTIDDIVSGCRVLAWSLCFFISDFSTRGNANLLHHLYFWTTADNIIPTVVGFEVK